MVAQQEYYRSDDDRCRREQLEKNRRGQRKFEQELVRLKEMEESIERDGEIGKELQEKLEKDLGGASKDLN